MKTIRKLTALLAIGTLVLLTGCAGHSVKGDLPESMQAHLQAHPGDIRFNRPKIVWKVDWDEGRHVLPEEVYLQLYKDLLNRVWDDAGLDQGSGKAYDVTVEVPLYFDYPGGHWVADYVNGYTGYWITVTDPQTGQVVGEWGNHGTDNPYSNSHAHWRAGSPDAPTCNELGHWIAFPMAGLVTAAPLGGRQEWPGSVAGGRNSPGGARRHVACDRQVRWHWSWSIHPLQRNARPPSARLSRAAEGHRRHLPDWRLLLRRRATADDHHGRDEGGC